MIAKRKILAVFAALAFVAVQAADLALLDAAHADEAAAHVPAEPGAEGPHACGGDGDDSCAWHCPCHILHHVFASFAFAPLTCGAYDTTRLIPLHNFGTGMAYRPPVPPPLA